MTSPVVPPTMTLPPPAPDRADRSTFSARATAQSAFYKDVMTPEIQAAINNAYANAVSSHDGATESQANNAASYQNYLASLANAVAAATSVGATLWAAGSYPTGTPVYSPTSSLVYRRKAPGGASPTDPALDPMNWSLAIIAAPLYRPETGASATAEVNVDHGLRYAGAQELVMPGSPVQGDVFWVRVENGRTDNYLTTGGEKINGESMATLVLDDPFAALCCRYTGSSYGWSI